MNIGLRFDFGFWHFSGDKYSFLFSVNVYVSHIESTHQYIMQVNEYCNKINKYK